MTDQRGSGRVPRAVVVGGGLAGCEAAWQLARAGVEVELLEMRPQRTTPAHSSPHLAELVCSNSLRGESLSTAVGLLKAEMEALDSLIVAAARVTRVPAGGALAVDRGRFALEVEQALASLERVEIVRREVVELPDVPGIVATGPLTSSALHIALERLLGEGALAFFDAVAPIVVADSLDFGRLFRASRYGKGGGDDYLNAALDRHAYEAFVDALLSAERVELRQFEREQLRFFEGCLPIEVMAERGRDTLRFGPMKPVGLSAPDGRRPWAVVQLRQDDLAAEHFNIVGFQTKLTQGEQRRVFRTIPGLERARFARYGMLHRNTFVNAPAHLDPLLRLRKRPALLLAGQLTGVEGYVESAATGLLAGRNLAALLRGATPPPPPPQTALGGLVRHLTARPATDFEPSNITWGTIVTPEELFAVRDRRARRLAHARLALDQIRAWSDAT